MTTTTTTKTTPYPKGCGLNSFRVRSGAAVLVAVVVAVVAAQALRPFCLERPAGLPEAVKY